MVLKSLGKEKDKTAICKWDFCCIEYYAFLPALPHSGFYQSIITMPLFLDPFQSRQSDSVKGFLRPSASQSIHRSVTSCFQMRPRISIRGLVRPSVGPSVGRSVRNVFVKINENGLLWILSDRGSAGRGRKRNKEEGGTRRKEGRGGRRDKEEGATRRVEKWKKL